MKPLLSFITGRRHPMPWAGFDMLPESVAYSAMLASGVEGSQDMSFAEFVAVIHGRRTISTNTSSTGANQ